MDQWRKDVYQAGSYQLDLKRISFKDAYEFTVNVSQIPDEVLIEEQKKMENFVRGFKI